MKKRSESLNSNLSKSSLTINFGKEKNCFGSNFSLGDTFKVGYSSLLTINELTNARAKAQNMTQDNETSYQSMHAQWRDLIRQEKETKKQIEDFRLDSWQIDNVIKLLKQEEEKTELSPKSRKLKSERTRKDKKGKSKGSTAGETQTIVSRLVNAVEQQEHERTTLEVEIIKHLHARLLLESEGHYLLERLKIEGANMDSEKLSSIKEKLSLLSESNQSSLDIRLNNHNAEDSGIFEYCTFVNIKAKLNQRKSWIQEDGASLQKKKIDVERKAFEEDNILYQDRLNRCIEPIDSTRRTYIRAQTI